MKFTDLVTRNMDRLLEVVPADAHCSQQVKAHIGLVRINIRLAHRSIALKLNGDRTARTYLRTVDGPERMSGATTRLYDIVRNILQRAADIVGKPFTYTFETNDEKLLAWANTAGRKIFAWDPSKDVIEGQQVRATFTPTGSK